MKRYTGVVNEELFWYRYLFSSDPIQLPTENGIRKLLGEDHLVSGKELYEFSRDYTGELTQDLFFLGFKWPTTKRKRLTNTEKLAKEFMVDFAVDWIYEIELPYLISQEELRDKLFEFSVSKNIISQESISQLYIQKIYRRISDKRVRFMDYPYEKFCIYYVITHYEIFI